MRLGVMQPYIFPYIGYYQLINAVDKFVVYDDVNFIKQGWINRNQILLNGKALGFTIPLKDSSSFKHINEILLDDKSYPLWRSKFYKTLEQAYKKAPQYQQVRPLLTQVFDDCENCTISDLTTRSLKAVCGYLDIKTVFETNPGKYQNNDLTAQDRIIDICRQEKASIYTNAIGGRSLYSFNDFKMQGFQLKFIEGVKSSYPQYTFDFVYGLSMIDVLMFNKIDDIKKMLNNFTLITE